MEAEISSVNNYNKDKETWDKITGCEHPDFTIETALMIPDNPMYTYFFFNSVETCLSFHKFIRDGIADEIDLSPITNCNVYVITEKERDKYEEWKRLVKGSRQFVTIRDMMEYMDCCDDAIYDEQQELLRKGQQ